MSNLFHEEIGRRKRTLSHGDYIIAMDRNRNWRAFRISSKPTSRLDDICQSVEVVNLPPIMRRLRRLNNCGYHGMFFIKYDRDNIRYIPGHPVQKEHHSEMNVMKDDIVAVFDNVVSLEEAMRMLSVAYTRYKKAIEEPLLIFDLALSVAIEV